MFGFVEGKHVEINDDLSETILAYDVAFKIGPQTYRLRCRPSWIVCAAPP
jgi:hypothetical protein